MRLLFEALRQSGCVGVAKIAMHNREHIVILRPGPKGILLHTMYYPDEIRQVEEFRTDTSIVKAKELEMAKMLIDSLLAAFEPEKYKDDYRENLMAMIKAKVEGRQIVETVETKHKAPVVDILEALKMSLAEVKKPIRSSTGTAAVPVEEEPVRPRKAAKPAAKTFSFQSGCSRGPLTGISPRSSDYCALPCVTVVALFFSNSHGHRLAGIGKLNGAIAIISSTRAHVRPSAKLACSSLMPCLAWC